MSFLFPSKSSNFDISSFNYISLKWIFCQCQICMCALSFVCRPPYYSHSRKALWKCNKNFENCKTILNFTFTYSQDTRMLWMRNDYLKMQCTGKNGKIFRLNLTFTVIDFQFKLVIETKKNHLKNNQSKTLHLGALVHVPGRTKSHPGWKVGRSGNFLHLKETRERKKGLIWQSARHMWHGSVTLKILMIASVI